MTCDAKRLFQAAGAAFGYSQGFCAHVFARPRTWTLRFPAPTLHARFGRLLTGELCQAVSRLVKAYIPLSPSRVVRFMEAKGEPDPTSAEGLRQRGQGTESKEEAVQDVPSSGDGADHKHGHSHGAVECQAAHAVPGRIHKNRKQTCFMRFLGSTPFKLFTLSIVAVVPVFGTVFALPQAVRMCGINSLLWQWLHRLFAYWISVMVVFNFAMSQFTEPGRTTDIHPTNEATGQFHLTPPVEGEKESERILYAPNYCEHCKHWKPPRSHHCSIYGKCVLRMDHYCPFTGNCIGFRNHGHFVLMYIFAMVGISYSVALCANAVSNSWWSGVRFEHGLRKQLLPFINSGLVGFVVRAVLFLLDVAGWRVGTQFVLSLLMMLVVFSCGCPALHIALSNVTTIEMRFPMKEYVQIKPKIYCPLGVGFYRQSVKQNLLDLLGENWRLRLLLPILPRLDVQVATMPAPSPEGVQALKDRIRQVETEGVKQEVASIRDLGLNAGPKAPNGGDTEKDTKQK